MRNARPSPRPTLDPTQSRRLKVSVAAHLAVSAALALLALPAAAQPRPHRPPAAPAATPGSPDPETPASSPAAAPSPASSSPRAPSPAPSPASLPAQPTADPATDAPAPASDEAPPQAPPSASAPEPAAADQEQAEIAALQAELSQVMDDLVQARTRVAVLGKSLFTTRVRVKLDNRAAPDQTVARAQLWLDGPPIFSGDAGALRDPERTLWEGFAAPGAHVLTLEVEHRARDDEAFRYTLRESFRFMVVREHRTDLRLVLEDDSDMAEEFPDDKEGNYEVQTRLEARAVRAGDD